MEVYQVLDKGIQLHTDVHECVLNAGMYYVFPFAEF